MLIVEKVDKDNRQCVIDWLGLSVVKHVFAFYDLQYDFEHMCMHVAFEREKLKGYILVYTALDVPSVVLECERDVAERLIMYTPEDKFILHAPPNLLSTVIRRFPEAKHYVEKWMTVKRGCPHPFPSKNVRKLCSEDDASQLALLLSTRDDRPRGMVERYVESMGKMPVYGVFMDGKLVSYAGSFIQLPEVWMMGGVYTHPKYRNKAYSTLAVSAVTEEALRNAKVAALFVRADNYPAVRVYEKIGYRKVGEKLWVDVGTGLRP